VSSQFASSSVIDFGAAGYAESGKVVTIERNLFLGCDPGQSGGLVILDHYGAVVDVTPMPETVKDICDYMAEFSPRIRMAVLESVHAMPKQGVSSAFKFGRGFGVLHAALVAFGIPFEFVLPGKWQQPLGCILQGRTGPEDRKTEKKAHNKARAQELFPGQKVTHAIADALLMAEYCRRVNIER
jgi:hypothetical protein